MDRWNICFYVQADSIEDAMDMIDEAQGCVGASENYNYQDCGAAGISVDSCYYNYGETGDDAFDGDDICEGIFENFDASFV